MDLREAMLSFPDKRTINGLHTQMKSLKNDPETRAEYIILCALDENLKICFLFHKSVLMDMDWPETLEAIDKMSALVSPETWPEQVIDLLLGKTVKSKKLENDYEGLFHTTEPYGSATLDLKQVCVKALIHLTATGKISVFYKLYWREAFVPLLADGAVSAPTVLKMVEVATSHFSTFDLVEAETEIQNSVREVLSLWNYVGMLGWPHVGAEMKVELFKQ